ncbi:hypothetical protein P376_0192 [Streptomyces sp. HCCB10043]|nr:hypothetical protein P376_0192 [Streptomyces sp. HCCB10043]
MVDVRLISRTGDDVRDLRHGRLGGGVVPQDGVDAGRVAALGLGEAEDFPQRLVDHGGGVLGSCGSSNLRLTRGEGRGRPSPRP